ncbi:hypothetical protein ACFYRC_28195 [Streptomyces sp. NPDC005279]|uniref:hypothetical protein n=1 Tax=Streptomyces sp. NPDC005279 TaxID=3364712 RepID=UPI0036902934
MLSCRLFGHRFRFLSDADTMRWQCARGCGAGGSKRYPTAEEAKRYARAFDREDREDLGRRAPLVGLFPLRLMRALRIRREEKSEAGSGAERRSH